ncbi:hypothetical protein MUK42_10435, partial [Musa troglodytarum]
ARPYPLVSFDPLKRTPCAFPLPSRKPSNRRRRRRGERNGFRFSPHRDPAGRDPGERGRRPREAERPGEARRRRWRGQQLVGPAFRLVGGAGLHRRRRGGSRARGGFPQERGDGVGGGRGEEAAGGAKVRGVHGGEGKGAADAEHGDGGLPRRDVPLRHRLPPRLRPPPTPPVRRQLRHSVFSIGCPLHRSHPSTLIRKTRSVFSASGLQFLLYLPFF